MMPTTKEDEPRRRRKEYDRDSTTSKTSDKDKDRQGLSRKLHRRRSDDIKESSPHREFDRVDKSATSDMHSRSSKRQSTVVPEMERRSSTGTGETRSTAYPSFSKAHSKMAADGREEVPASPKPKVTIITPDPTDLNTKRRTHDQPRSRSPVSSTAEYRAPSAATPASQRRSTRAPPSPPSTADELDLKRASSTNSSRQTAASRERENLSRRRSAESALRRETASKSSNSGSGSVSNRRRASPTSLDSEVSEDERSSRKKYSTARNSSADSRPASVMTQTTADSQATPVQSDIKGRPVNQGSASSRLDSSPRTPSMHEEASHPATIRPKSTNPEHIKIGGFSQYPGAGMDSMTMPPPPPPPMMFSSDPPRVDYLLQNGGLPHPIPKSLLPLNAQQPLQAYQQYASPHVAQGFANNGLAQIFAPISNRLDEFSRVLAKNGSVAVATGYRSVARRLLDRLEHVFNRNISSEHCLCVMCKITSTPLMSDEEDTGVSWGEILELVSGRRELPQWPPFSISAESPGLGISEAPMQKIDPDVPDEYRDHYVRQNAKTKRVVQDWLSRQPQAPSSPPQDVDDETLTFAMLTHLAPEKRRTFTALIKGLSAVPVSRTPTPAQDPCNEVLAKTALALQRLYRLPSLPRAPESTMYLLNNPQLHSMLATLSAVSPGEWDILISGRFDGFLWSGAETPMPPSASAYNPRAPSRTTTPFANMLPSRGTTPFSPLRSVMSPNGFPLRASTPAHNPSSLGAPVQLDEETEIAVLAEVEREIFRNMEALEDQFELVHRQAEEVRNMLIARSAGLSQAAQARRGSLGEDVGVRVDTPASVNGAWGDDEAWADDGASLAPDDSASNAGFGRRRRREKRGDRRTTPAVEEEDERDERKAPDQSGGRRRR